MNAEQLRADRARHHREIATWKSRANLPEDHPNIQALRRRIQVIDKLLEVTP